MNHAVPDVKKVAAMWKIGVVVLLAAVLAVWAFLLNRNGPRTDLSQTGSLHVEYAHAKVLAVTSQSLTKDPDTGYQIGTQKLQLRINSGTYRNEVDYVENTLNNYDNIVAHVGQTLIVRISSPANSAHSITVFSYDRAPVLFALLAVLLALLFLVGGWRGVGSAIGLGASFVCIVFIYIPMVLRGFSPVLGALFITFFVASITLILLAGFTRKALTAMLGTMSGIVLALLLSLASGALLHLNGFNLEDAEVLVQLAGKRVQVGTLFFGGILISSLGAILDIAMSIVSSMDELYRSNPSISSRELFRSGFRISRDMVGTMVNTLILAFAGSSMMGLMLICSNNVSFNQLINANWIGTEAIASVSGGIAIILIAPLIAFVGARLIPLRLQHKPPQH